MLGDNSLSRETLGVVNLNEETMTDEADFASVHKHLLY